MIIVQISSELISNNFCTGLLVLQRVRRREQTMHLSLNCNWSHSYSWNLMIAMTSNSLSSMLTWLSNAIAYWWWQCVWNKKSSPQICKWPKEIRLKSMINRRDDQNTIKLNLKPCIQKDKYNLQFRNLGIKWIPLLKIWGIHWSIWAIRLVGCWLRFCDLECVIPIQQSIK